MAVLRTEGLSRVYHQGDIDVRALKDCSFSVEKGEFVAVVGASGSGKSTLLNLCGGLDRPTGGKVFLGDVELYTNSDEKLAEIRRRKIGFIFQNYQLVPIMTAYENFVMPALLDKRKIEKEYVEELAEALGIRDRLHHFPSQLSGGQQQRVAIGRALVNHPELILADEPTGNLDKESAGEVIDLLVSTIKRFDGTIVMITHELAIAERADRIFRIDDGVLTEEK
ncbi:MAG: ABC transporter ATP-binding protein [Lachnospiraceae bacterium]|nr:ABC transporter ATP-binding protein [Lachnospiraceae bacterium]